MVKNAKIIIFIIFVLLIAFLIFRNIRGVEEASRNLPSNEQLEEFSNVSFKSSANSYEVKDIPDRELATIYYNHFKDLIINNEEEAYKRLRSKDDTTLAKYEELKSSINSNYYGNKVESYRISKNSERSIYRIVNSDKKTIIFYVDAVFKYEVDIV